MSWIRALGLLAVSLFCVFAILWVIYKRSGGPLKSGHLLGAICGYALGLTIVATALVMLQCYFFWMLCGIIFVLAFAGFIFGKCIKQHTTEKKSGFWRALLTAIRPKKSVGTLAVIIIVLAGMWYALFPTNYLFGGRDYGLYMINAVHVSKTGSYQYETDEWYQENYEEVKDFIMYAYPALFDAQLNGSSDEPGNIDPQFLPMTSSIMVVGYDIGGLSGLLRVNALFATLCLWLIFGLARRFFGDKVALLATVFLAICPAQVWAARITGSEILAQFFFLVAASCFAHIKETGKNNNSLWALAGGLTVGLCCFLRIDNYVLLIALFAVTCYSILWQPSAAKNYAIASGVGAVLGALSVWYGFAFHYTYFLAHWNMEVLSLLVLACLACGALTLLLFLLKRPLARLNIPNPIKLIHSNSVWGAVTFVILVALWFVGYCLRPLWNDTAAGRSLIEYSWYMSAIAIPFAILGFYALLRKGNEEKINALLFFGVCGLGSVVMYSIQPSITPDHFWASRRWVSVNFPFVLMFAASGLGVLWKAAASKKAALIELRIGAALCACFMFGYMAWQCRLFAFRHVMGGVDGQYAALAEVLPDDGIIIADDAQIASVLRFVYDKPVYLRNWSQATIDTYLEEDRMPLTIHGFDGDALMAYLENHGPVYIVGSSGSYWQFGALEQLYNSTLAVDYPTASFGAYPRIYDRWNYDVSVYRLTGGDFSSGYDYLPSMVVGAGYRNDDGSIVSVGSGPVFYGPYTTLRPGNYSLKVTIRAERDISANLYAATQAGQNILAQTSVTKTGTYTISFTLEETTDNVEFVLSSDNDAEIEISKIYLSYQK